MVLLENTVNSKEIKFSYNCIPPRYNLCYYCSIRFNVLAFVLIWAAGPMSLEEEETRELPRSTCHRENAT